MSIVTRREFLFGSVAGLVLAGCAPAPKPYVETKINPPIYSEHINNDDNLSPSQLSLVQKYRNDWFSVLREFTPDSYLARGVYAYADGTGYWAERARKKYISEEDGLYAIGNTVMMGPNGQPYTVSNHYDVEDILRRSVFLPGSVPSFISTDQLPKAVPGMGHLHIPRESIREVAEMVFDLPKDLEWKSSLVKRLGYMAPPPEREFLKLEATGKTRDGRPVRLGIDEQTFSSLIIEQSPFVKKLKGAERV